MKLLLKNLREDASFNVEKLKPRSDDKTKGGTYGEAMPNLVSHFIRKLNISSTDVFCDIGSGIFFLNSTSLTKHFFSYS